MRSGRLLKPTNKLTNERAGERLNERVNEFKEVHNQCSLEAIILVKSPISMLCGDAMMILMIKLYTIYRARLKAEMLPILAKSLFKISSFSTKARRATIFFHAFSTETHTHTHTNIYCYLAINSLFQNPVTVMPFIHDSS